MGNYDRRIVRPRCACEAVRTTEAMDLLSVVVAIELYWRGSVAAKYHGHIVDWTLEIDILLR